MGYNTRDSQLLVSLPPRVQRLPPRSSSTAASCVQVAPLYVVAAVLAFIGAYLSDKWRMRGAFLMFQAVVCLIGIIVVGYASGSRVRYFGLYLTLWGT